jgi:hypothetical protein
VGFLAEALTAAERAVAGPGAEPWYAGEDYEGRMVASPEEGTRLSLEQVVGAISGPLALRRVRPRWVVPSAAAALALAALGVALALKPGLLTSHRGADPLETQPTAEEARLAAEHARRAAEQAAAARASFAARKDRALLVATERFQDPQWRRLRYPVKQATALEAALERRGFQVTLLQNPTFDEVTGALQRSKAEPWGPYDQLVVYFAGHGGVFRQLGTGRLVLADSRGENTNYLSLADLRQALVEHRARHVLLVLDSCYAGKVKFEPQADLAGTEVAYRAGGPAPEIDEATAMEKLSVPTRRYLAAVGRDVTPDNSRFTAELIAFLSSDAPGYLTDLSLRARLEGVHPTPRYGGFEGDDEAGGIVFRPPAAPPRPPGAARGPRIARRTS